jgi:CYTH domain-containing protein
MEIERKFTVDLNSLPADLGTYKCHTIEQGYLCTSPTVRIRQWDDDFILTYKQNKHKKKNKSTNVQSSAIVNNEIEMDLTRKAYLHLRDKCDLNIINKTRYIIPLQDGLKAELDVFAGKLSGLAFAEVEFDSIEGADAFNPPKWMTADVSGDKRYRNSHLAETEKYRAEDFL